MFYQYSATFVWPSLWASSAIWASEARRVRTSAWAARPRGVEESRVLSRDSRSRTFDDIPKWRACSQVTFDLRLITHEKSSKAHGFWLVSWTRNAFPSPKINFPWLMQTKKRTWPPIKQSKEASLHLRVFLSVKMTGPSFELLNNRQIKIKTNTLSILDWSVFNSSAIHMHLHCLFV